MALIDTIVGCDIRPSFRVHQAAGMFDVPIERRAWRRFSVEVPTEAQGWQIGAILGPSGSGKTTAARAAFGPQVWHCRRWPGQASILDAMGRDSIRTITATLTVVGLSSPPAWLRPYRTLSNGERFRADLARALLTGGPRVVFDEFTSVVDRTVARVASAAVAKAVRAARTPARQFVAVSCHYDILPWLGPDWVLDMATGRLARGSLQRPLFRRPRMVLQLVRCRREAWKLFAPHHYLSGELHVSSQCYLATWRRRPVCFVAMLHAAGHARWQRVSRIVTLPDYQGVGIAGAVLDAVCDLTARQGRRVTITTGHPAMIRRLTVSPRWRCTRVRPVGQGRNSDRAYAGAESVARAVASFEFVS